MFLWYPDGTKTKVSAGELVAQGRPQKLEMIVNDSFRNAY